MRATFVRPRFVGFDGLLAVVLIVFVAVVWASDVYAATGTCESLPGGAIEVEGPGGVAPQPTGYSTLRAAFAAINAGAHSGGTIVIDVCGDTAEVGSAVVNGSGGTATYTAISIRPVGGSRKISGSIAGALIDLNGADAVTIDGMNSGGNSLTLDNTNTGATASTIQFRADASNNTVQNCTIRGAETGTASGTIAFNTGTTIGNIGNVINANKITSSGVNLPTNAIYSAGTSGAVANTATITYNDIQDYFNPIAASNGVFIASNSYGWMIKGNKMFQTAPRNPFGDLSYRAINISGGGHTIDGNTIGYAAADGTGRTYYSSTLAAFKFFPIQVIASSPASVIKGNTITAISLTTASGASAAPGIFTGISVLSGSASVGTTGGNVIGAPVGNSAITVKSMTSGAFIGGITAGTENSFTSASIQNNVVGAIDTDGTATTGYVFKAIATLGSRDDGFSISGNTIGSPTTANSIAIGTSGGTTAATTVVGISTSAAAFPPGGGQISHGSVSITGNTITNCSTNGSGASVFSGIENVADTPTVTITSNNIVSVTNLGTGALQGIVSSGGRTTARISDNVIRNHTVATATGSFVGISNAVYGSQAYLPTTYLENNQLGNESGGLVSFTSAIAASGSVTGISNSSNYHNSVSIKDNDIRGIVYSTPAGSSNHLYLNNVSSNGVSGASSTISGNTFTRLSFSTTGNVTFIQNTGNSPGSRTTSNNSIVESFTKTGDGGAVTLYAEGGGGNGGAGVSNTNNNFSNLTVTGATAVVGWVNANGDTLSTKNITGNTFSNWSCGTGPVTVLQVPSGPISSLSNNTITNISGQGAITGVLVGTISTSWWPAVLTGNTVTELVSTGTGGAVLGISSGQDGATISQNTIHGLSGVREVTGIVATTAYSLEISHNKIYDLSTNGSFTPGVNGIVVSGRSGEISNNVIGDLKAPLSSSLDAIRGISILGNGASSGCAVYYNTVHIEATSSGANFGTTGLFQVASANANNAGLLARNNIIDNRSTPNGSGQTVVFRRSGGLAGDLNNYDSSSNNNDFFLGEAGPNKFIYSDGVSTAATIDSYKAGVFQAGTIAPRDTLTFSDATYLSTDGPSPNFLHIDPTVPTGVESGGQRIFSVNDDFDGEGRNASTPDVGADEFNGIRDRCAAVVCSAGTVCMPGVCDPADGVCKPSYAGYNTPCGDPDNSFCNAPDTCDGAGVCVDRKKPANAVCLPGDASGCNPDDVCDGTTSFCASVYQPARTACGDSDSTACNAPDTCDRTGTCVNRVKPANTLCLAASEDCDVDDVCDGTSSLCPATYATSTAECRASTGSCDPAEYCTGSTAICPMDIDESTPVGDSVRVSQDRLTNVSTISWNDAVPGPFNAYRGARLDQAPWQYNHTCHAQGLTSPSTSDAETPVSGELFYYLVSRNDDTCPESGLGPDSSGADRPNTVPCP